MATQQPDDGTRQPATSEPVVEALDEMQCLSLIAGLGVQAWAGGRKEQFIRIIPRHVTGRRIRRAPEPV